MKQFFFVAVAMIAYNALVYRPAAAQTYAATEYAKRIKAVRQLDREILQKHIEAEGMLRVAGELQRKKPRPRPEAQMIVARYDDFTKTLVDTRQQEAQIMAAIATIDSSADVAELRRELEIAKRTMELRFKKQQVANAQLRKSKRQRGTKAKDNRRLQSVIEQQKQAKQAYDAKLKVIAEQLKLLRTIDSGGGPGGEQDTAGAQLHSTLTNFEFVIKPQREQGRSWVEKQVEYALLDSVDQRVRMRDDFRNQAETIRQEVDLLTDRANKLLSGPAAADDLRQLANLVQGQTVNPAANVNIALTAPGTDSVSYAPKGLTVLRQNMAFSGRAGDMQFEAILSPSLTLEETHAPQWALKYKDKYPFVHSAGVLSLWVGEFHIIITPKNDLARQASPGNRSNMLQWIDDTLRLDQLAAL